MPLHYSLIFDLNMFFIMLDIFEFILIAELSELFSFRFGMSSDKKKMKVKACVFPNLTMSDSA